MHSLKKFHLHVEILLFDACQAYFYPEKIRSAYDNLKSRNRLCVSDSAECYSTDSTELRRKELRLDLVVNVVNKKLFK